MEWRVGLIGDEHDLKMLAKTFRTDNLKIASEQISSSVLLTVSSREPKIHPRSGIL